MNQFKNLSRGTLVSISNGYLTTPWQSDRIVVFDSKMFWWKKVQESGAQWGELNWKYNGGHHFHIFLNDNAGFSWPSVSLLRNKRLRVSSLRSSTDETKKTKKKMTGIEEGNGRELSSLRLGSALGEKGKKIGERSEPRGSLGRGKRRRRFPPPQTTARLASLTNIFPIWPLFLPFFPAAEPGPRPGREKV